LAGYAGNATIYVFNKSDTAGFAALFINDKGNLVKWSRNVNVLVATTGVKLAWLDMSVLLADTFKKYGTLSGKY
jgi:hypothetical protein